MSKFNAFRRKLDINEKCIANYESSFITEGTSAVRIYSLRLQDYKQAAIIITDKEGPDTSLVYTFKEKEQKHELLKGDYYTWNTNTYFVYEDISIVLDCNYKKQKSYQCNAQVSYKDIVVGGYFVSSLSKFIDTTLQSNLNITDNDKPVLILPNCDWVKVGEKVVIKNRAYKIIDVDNLTNDNITYCSLELGFVDTQEDIVIDDARPTLIAGIEQTISTENEVFSSNCKVDIVRKHNNEITIIIPYGIKEIELTTQLNAKNITKTYKVVV